MLLGVDATRLATAPPPLLAGFTTAAAVGQLVLFGLPSESSGQVAFRPPSASSVPALIRPRYFLKMWVVPDSSARTILVIDDVGTQPAPSSVSPPSVISLHFEIVPLYRPSRVVLFSTRRPGAALLFATHFSGRRMMIAIAICATGMLCTVSATLPGLVSWPSISSVCFWFGASSVPTYANVPASKAWAFTPHFSRPAPLPAASYSVSFGVPFEPCVPRQAFLFADVLNWALQVSWSSFCVEAPAPLMFSPEHCCAALAAPGATNIAAATAERMHAVIIRRAES